MKYKLLELNRVHFQPRPGVKYAPEALRNVNLIKNLSLMGHEVIDHGDLKFEAVPNDTAIYNIQTPRTIGKAAKQISDKVEEILRCGQTVVTLGGDHSMSVATIHGHAKVENDLAIIWIDAHPDINTPLTSASGNIHGMPLSFLTKELQPYVPKLPGFEWLKPCISVKDIAFIGVRDIDKAERYIIDKYNITTFTMRDIDKLGMECVLERTIEAINPTLNKKIHMSFDIDSLDPAFAPSTGTPVPYGLSLREGMFLVEEIALTNKVTGIDLVEINPDLGSQRDQFTTISAAAEVLYAFFGKRTKTQLPSDYVLPKP
ncbi:DgyrCDS2851 [Dimorphilus gyrociliatus]|uniref:Arginase n=1 Tax=Dimorphilus gyrociliatus TaxID=2664684 RepID=A0A7I8VCQ4_9ANNE|nr:DgyrCDS2851 [Dimorphilus gyrociliatus]